tara:strand:- start:112 stop:321 length:210 start_codon:yes stop_codon:yes gene_type:complete
MPNISRVDRTKTDFKLRVDILLFCRLLSNHQQINGKGANLMTDSLTDYTDENLREFEAIEELIEESEAN